MSSKEFQVGHNAKNLSKGTPGNDPGINIERNMRNPTGSYGMRFEAGSSFEIRVSHLLKAFCIWVVVVVITGLFLHSRIRSLELDRNDLERKVDFLNKRIEVISERIEYLLNEDPKINYGDEVFQEEPEVTRNKRSADQSSLNEMNKNTAPTDPGSKPYGLSSPVRKSSKNEENVMRETNPTFSSSTPSVKMIRQIIRKETKKFKTATRLQVKALNRKIRNLQEKQNQSSSPEVAPQKTGGRAAYLQLDRLSLNIQRKKQLIGPWYLPDEGQEIGFGNAGWYNNLTLDSDGTSIIFEEAGLFLIYAQIFYQLQPHHNDRPNPMGYRIYLKRSISGKDRSSGKAIAECVPSFPATLLQTCFTQVAWFMEAKDEIYVEHFTESKPIIEASKMGQTFVGIVKLS